MFILRINVRWPICCRRWLQLFPYPRLKIISFIFHFYLGFVFTAFEFSTLLIYSLKVRASYINVLCWISHKRFCWNIVDPGFAVKWFLFRLSEGAIVSWSQWVIPNLVRNSLLSIEFCESKGFPLIDPLNMNIALIYNTLPLIWLF